MRGCGQDQGGFGEDGDSAPLTVGIDIRGTCATCVVRGEVDVATASRLADEMDRLVDLGATTVVLDLGDVSFFGIEGVSVVERVRRRLGNDNGLIVQGAAPIVQRMLDLCGLAGLIEPAPLG